MQISDNDGDPDIVINVMNQPSIILKIVHRKKN